MIVIDTNIVSGMMREQADPGVLAWAETVGPLHTTAITLAEVGCGIARLPDGARKDRLAAAAAAVFADFGDVILAFDTDAARRYAEIVAGCDRAGLPITGADAQIAAICSSREAQLATRNTGEFAGTGIGLINPWDGDLQRRR